MTIRSVSVGAVAILGVSAIAAPTAGVASMASPNVARIQPPPCAPIVPTAIQVGPGAYGPQTQKGLVPGSQQSWIWVNGATDESVTSTPISLFDSGTSATSYAFTFFAAGTYTYHSTGAAVPDGVVEVKICQLPATAHQGAVVYGQIASVHHSGWVEDVQYHRPGASTWQWLAYGSTADWFNFTAGRVGTYYVRTRLRQTSTNKTSGFSPTGAVKVS